MAREKMTPENWIAHPCKPRERELHVFDPARCTTASKENKPLGPSCASRSRGEEEAVGVRLVDQAEEGEVDLRQRPCARAPKVPATAERRLPHARAQGRGRNTKYFSESICVR